MSAPLPLSNAQQVPECPLCGSGRIAAVGPLDYGSPLTFGSVPIALQASPELYRCLACQSAFTQHAVHEDDAERLYREGDSSARWNYRPLEEDKTDTFISIVRDHCRPRSNVLDVGCNEAALLDYVLGLGCKATGVEPSNAARLAALRRGHVVYESLAAARERAPYDVVFASDVIEHIYDVGKFINSCRELLGPEGALVCLTGDIACLSARLTGSRWWYVSYPEHVRFPSRQYLASQAGFRLLEIHRTLASKLHRQSISAALKNFLIALWQRNYRGQPALGADHMIIVLQKTADTGP